MSAPVDIFGNTTSSGTTIASMVTGSSVTLQLASADQLVGLGGAGVTVTTTTNPPVVAVGDGGTIPVSPVIVGTSEVTVTLPGPRANYTITPGDNGLTLTDNSGHTGVYQLHDVDRVVFQDGALALDVGVGQHGGEAYRLYQAALDRAPDSVGLGYWLHQLDQGVSLHDVANDFMQSAEFSALMGGAQPGVSTFVTKLYDDVLHRAPDAAGYTYWTDALAHGVSRADVLVAFSESPESQAQVVGTIAHGFSYTLYV